MVDVGPMLVFSDAVWNKFRAKLSNPKCGPSDNLVCSMDCLEYTKCYPEAFNKLVSATKDAVSSVKMMEGVMEMTDDTIWTDRTNTIHPLMSGDTDISYHQPCDTGCYPGDLPSAYYGRPIVRSTKVDNSHCPYCNVRALPNDRFCEGCGAPV